MQDLFPLLDLVEELGGKVGLPVTTFTNMHIKIHGWSKCQPVTNLGASSQRGLDQLHYFPIFLGQCSWIGDPMAILERECDNNAHMVERGKCYYFLYDFAVIGC